MCIGDFADMLSARLRQHDQAEGIRDMNPFLLIYAAIVVITGYVAPASEQPVTGHLLAPDVRTVIPVSDRLPNFNVKGLCEATTADDKAAGLALAQPVENCVRDETAAKQQLAAIWEQNAGPARDTCEGEAANGPSDSQSYVDLLTCMQMAGVTTTGVQAATLRGGSKKRNKN
jgi:hypothetical protein